MPKKLYTRTKIGLIVIFLLTGFIIFSHSAIGQRLNLSPDLVVAIQNFLASDMQIKACDYKDGMILLVKPVATGQAGDSGRYEAGDIIEIRDGTKLCENFGDKSPLSKKELTHLLPLYYPAKLTEEQIRELTEPEYQISNDKSETIEQEQTLKMRKMGLDYTAILDQSEITKKTNLKNINRIPTIDLNIIKEKTEEQKAVVSINDYTPPTKTTWQKFVDIMRPTAYALTNPVVVVDTGGTGDYTSLNAAVAAEQRDLTSSDEQITFKCQSTNGVADVAATVNGFTTDSTRYVKIWTDPNESYRWNDVSRGSARNTYPTSGNYYRIEATNAECLTLSDDYISVIGLAIKVTETDASIARGIYISSTETGDHYISKMYIKGVCSGTGVAQGIYFSDTSTTLKVYDSIITGFISGDDSGFSAFYSFVIKTEYLYNCTLFGNYWGVNKANGTPTLVNCIVANNTDDFVAGVSVTYSASDDSQSGTGNIQWTGGATDWNNVFTDYANGDFSLKNYTGTGAVIGAGTDNPGSGLYLDDILGNLRTSTWDIGAFEYVAGDTTTIKSPNEKGLVGWWKFDEGAGTKVGDSSGHKNTGTIYNADWSEGKLGKSLEFSGSPDYVDVGTNLDQNGEMTITAWINPSSITATNKDIISNSDGITDKDYKLQINRTGSLGKISAIWASTVVVTSNTAMSPGNWYHVAMVRSGTTGNWTVNMYLNGQDDGSGTTGTNPNGNNETTSIGRDGAGNQEYFPGKIDDVRIYNRALSAEEIAGLYKAGEARVKAPNDKGLVGYWKFDEATGTKALDSSGNKNTGTITGATWTSGKLGKALSFDGVSNVVTVSSDSLLNGSPAMTLSAWIYYEGGDLYPRIIDKGASSAYAFYVNQNISTLGAAIVTTGTGGGSSDWANQFGLTATLNTWQHVVFVWDSATAQANIYKNGVAGTPQSRDGDAVANNNSFNLRIGDVSDGSRSFKGKIDDVRIYNRALSAEEIKGLYQMGETRIRN